MHNITHINPYPKGGRRWLAFITSVSYFSELLSQRVPFCDCDWETSLTCSHVKQREDAHTVLVLRTRNACTSVITRTIDRAYSQAHACERVWATTTFRSGLLSSPAKEALRTLAKGIRDE